MRAVHRRGGGSPAVLSAVREARIARRALVAAGLGSLLGGCGVIARQGGVATPALPRPPAGVNLDAQAYQWARTAWRYIENNTDQQTGLVNGADRHPVVTAWNAGDALAAIVAARELGVIGPQEFDLRASRLLGFLGTMDLSGGLLPHKAYHAGTGRMINFEGRPDDIGWSAVDIGRLMMWLKIVGQRHPHLREYADKAVLRWNFCEAVDPCGRLFGSQRQGGQSSRYPEGRLGYEQYAAAGYAAWGFDMSATLSLPPTEAVNIFGLPVRYDARDARATGVQTPVLTMPWALLGMEAGWEVVPGSRGIAERIVQVQQERWRREGQLTARSDWQSREAPYTVLDSVFAAGYAWNTIGHDGKEYETLALVSTRAAFALWALWPGDYAARVIEGVRFMYDPDRGWYEGRLEAGGAPQANITLSTNAAVLESLLFKASGQRLLQPEAAGSHFQKMTADVFRRFNRCLPGERAACTPGR